jgi:hypothetical protein
MWRCGGRWTFVLPLFSVLYNAMFQGFLSIERRYAASVAFINIIGGERLGSDKPLQFERSV